MLVLTSKPWLIALLLVGMVAHGVWITTWAYVEIRGRIQSHTFLDTQLTYLVIVSVQAMTLGQLGPPQGDKPNFFTQLGQPNWQVVLFAVASGACIAVGDLFMQTAQAQLGVAVGPAVIFAVGIAGGVVLSYILDHGLNTAALLFTGGACALAAVVFGALAHVAANRNLPVYDISREASRSHRHAIVDLDASAHGYRRIAAAQRSAAEASKREPTHTVQSVDMRSRQQPQAASGTRKVANGWPAPEAGSSSHYDTSIGMPPDTAGEAGSAGQPTPHRQVAGESVDSRAVPSSAAPQGQGPAAHAVNSSVRGYWRALQALELAQAEASLATREASNSHGGHAAASDVEMQDLTACSGSRHADRLALEVIERERAESTGLQQQHTHVGHPGENGQQRHERQPGASTSAPNATDTGPVSNGHAVISVRSSSWKQAAPRIKNSRPASGRSRKHVRLGFAAALIGGVLYALLLPLYNLSVNDTLHTLPPGVPSLGVYSAYFYVAVASCGLSIICAPLLLRYPVKASSRSSIGQYLKDNHCRAWCMLAGVCLWIGDLAQFMGGQGAGFGVAYLVSAAPLVSTILGIILFGEFRTSSGPAKACLAAQVAFYAASIAFLIASAKSRS